MNHKIVTILSLTIGIAVNLAVAGGSVFIGKIERTTYEI